jgi:hypothetical protein
MTAAEPTAPLQALQAAIAACLADPLAFGAAAAHDLRPGRASLAGRLHESFVAAAADPATRSAAPDRAWRMLAAMATAMSETHGQPLAGLQVLELAAGQPGASQPLATELQARIATMRRVQAFNQAMEDARAMQYGSALRQLDRLEPMLTDAADRARLAELRALFRYRRQQAWAAGVALAMLVGALSFFMYSGVRLR